MYIIIELLKFLENQTYHNSHILQLIPEAMGNKWSLDSSPKKKKWSLDSLHAQSYRLIRRDPIDLMQIVRNFFFSFGQANCKD